MNDTNVRMEGSSADLVMQSGESLSKCYQCGRRTEWGKLFARSTDKHLVCPRCHSPRKKPVPTVVAVVGPPDPVLQLLADEMDGKP